MEERTYLAPEHKPCPDMFTGIDKPITPEQRAFNLRCIARLREKYGLRTSQQIKQSQKTRRFL